MLLELAVVVARDHADYGVIVVDEVRSVRLAPAAARESDREDASFVSDALSRAREGLAADRIVITSAPRPLVAALTPSAISSLR